MGEEIEALVLQKEDKEGRLILSKKRAQYERAWGTIERVKEANGVVSGPVIEVVKGGLILDIGLRGFLPASLVELRRVRDLQPYVGRTPRGQDHRARQAPQQRGAVPPGVAGGDPEGAARGLPREPQARRDPQGHGVLGRQLRRLRRPGRHGRPRPRVGAVLEARRPPRLGRAGGRRDRGPGARGRPRPRAHQPVPQGHPAGPVAGVRQQPPGRRAGLRAGHQAGPVRRLRAGRRGHRGPGAHLRDGRPPRRPARAGGHPRRGAVGQDHRPRPPAPADQPVDQAGRRGWCRGRRVPGGLRRARLRRAGQLHRRVRQRRLHARDGGPGGMGRVRRRARGHGGAGRREARSPAAAYRSPVEPDAGGAVPTAG